ncbi:DNA repair protein XRCC1 [Strigops habroptila]|uniref:DNA repair protein XRCC1 n=1 Tax=Strigops habroptila TaxID=2489341 RepID=UPI0011D02ADA|nr:DNA repair protein XRCC1 [Strigops habroptila]
MAEIQLLRVVAASSEDPRYPALNLLQPEAGGRWRGAKAGERQISVELELPAGQRIHRLLIGNNGSAFVEALVGTRDGGSFQVLLPAAAFMSPRESREGAEPRRGRSFGPEALVRGAAGGGWDRLRLVCTQPYSQDRPFGLSYVRVFAPPEDAAPAEAPVRRLGPFTLREGGASPLRPPGALFYQRPPSPPAPPSGAPPPGPSYADAALKASAGSAHKGRPMGPPGSSPGPSKLRPLRPKLRPLRPKLRPLRPRPRPPRPWPRPPWGGVVLALSGFENPLRGQLRAAAVAMGATYSPDWTPRCTHLVCAFPRTPKAARARAMGGLLVSPDWIWDCQSRGRRLPCRPYLLDGSASSGSEGEEPAEATPPPAHVPAGTDSDDGSDQSEPDDPYGGSTEENSEEEEEEEPIPPLPDFFRGLSFLLAGSFPEGEGRRLRRLVIAFGGTLAPSMSSAVTHVVTAQGWDEAFHQALELRPSLTIVRPHWLLRCGEQQRPLPAQPFAVVPADGGSP